MAIDRRLLTKGLQGAGERSYQRKDEGGGFRTYVKIPSKYKNQKMGKIAEGAFVFDIIPFMISEDFNQMYKKGQVEYVLEVWAHQNVGPGNALVICPNGTFQKKCPICEEVAKLKAAGADWKTQIAPMDMKRRCVYNIWVHDQAKKEELKGVQILEIAYFSLEKDIVAISKNPIDGGFIPFYDPDTGKHVCFTRQGTGKDNTKYLGYQFVDRKNPVIPDEILEQGVPLNEVIEVMSYDDLKALFHGGEVPEDEETQQPDAPEERKGAGSPAPAEQQAEDEPADETPAPQAAAPAAAPAAGSGRQRRQAAAPTETCPDPNGTFGVDSDKLEACKTCEKWDSCMDKFDELNG